MVKTFSFPIATHSYFTIRNLKSQRRAFLASDISQPSFLYGPDFVTSVVTERLRKVPADSPAAVSLSIVKAASELQSDAEKLKLFRRANLDFIHAPKKEYVMAILQGVSRKVNSDNQHLWEAILARVGTIEPTDQVVIPSSERFNMYRHYLTRYTGPFKTKDSTVSELLAEHLEITGLAKKGWRLKVRHNASPAKTNHRSRWVSIGEDYLPRTARAKKRIVVHEVYGHALRGPQKSIAEAEGFAIVLEQLTNPEFMYLRSYRYLAVALGWGVLGRRMTFREVFEILWRVMALGGQYTQQAAREHAFDECSRAFRGGRPDVAGAVFLKDSVYFDANIAMWKVLVEQELSYNEFVDIIEGRRTIL